MTYFHEETATVFGGVELTALHFVSRMLKIGKHSQYLKIMVGTQRLA